MDRPLISVIVPVYNVERYLEECILSIRNQTVCELQIILVDDGSTDTSGMICDRAAGEDSRIEVIHQKNAGVSAARNAGLRAAEGKYVAFVDSDDVLPEDAYECLLNCMLGDYLPMGRMQMMSENGELLDSVKFGVDSISKDDYLEDLFSEKTFPYLGFLVDKLFTSKMLKDHGIQFDEKIKLNEDRLFVLEYVIYCERICFDEHIVYHYRQRSTGIILETRRNSTVMDDEMTVMDSFRKMQKLCWNYSRDIYYVCSRKAFECALDLLKRVSRQDTEKIKRLSKFLWDNTRICLQNPRYSIYEKIKILLHAMLRR